MDHVMGLPYLWKIVLNLNTVRSYACIWKDKRRPPCTQLRDRALNISIAMHNCFLPGHMDYLCRVGHPDLCFTELSPHITKRPICLLDNMSLWIWWKET